MANQEQLEILKQGVDAWNKWREENPNMIVDLSWAHLQQVKLGEPDRITSFEQCGNLNKIDLSHADLRQAIVCQANLRGTNLYGADLRGANFQGADLDDAVLMRANLDGANFFHSNLTWANLNQAVLGSANLSFANLGNTILTSTSLRDVIGLDSIYHLSPSSVGIDTLRNFKGKVPENFLRGCGLSDVEIESAKLASPGLGPEQVTDITYRIRQLYLGGVPYYSCFISYSSKDDSFVRQLHGDLQNNGVRCWFAPEDMKIGDQIRPRIDQEIRLRDKLLVILSENSVNSEWVGDEVEGALEEEQKENRSVLFPIRLDDTVLDTRDDWAAKIKRRRHIGDFSNWKNKASYQKAFERLLRDLKASGGEVNGE